MAAASLFLDFHGERLLVRHGQSNDILLVVENFTDKDWYKLFNYIQSLDKTGVKKANAGLALAAAGPIAEYAKSREEQQTQRRKIVLDKFTEEPTKWQRYSEGGQTESQTKKIAKVMREFKQGKLHSGSKKGPIVKDRDQAVAIALSEAGVSKNK